MLASLVGPEIPGGCEICDAYQTMNPDPEGDGQIWHCTVHHDPSCPQLALHYDDSQVKGSTNAS
jgi:hypothetical protein